MKKTRKFGIAGVALVGGMLLAGCSDADVASQNLSTAADNFEIERRIVFLNVRSGEYELEIQGRCSIKDIEGQLEVTCRTGEDEYKKHFLGKGPDFTYFSEQIDPADVSEYHYRVIFKPQTIIPAPELDLG